MKELAQAQPIHGGAPVGLHFGRVLGSGIDHEINKRGYCSRAPGVRRMESGRSKRIERPELVFREKLRLIGGPSIGFRRRTRMGMR